MELLLLLIIVVIFIIGIPIGISYLIYNWIKKKDINRNFRILAIIPIVIVSYFIYDSIYPNEDFYKIDFKEVTTMEFPENGEIIYKNASFPDHFGDYTSSFLAEFENDYLKKLETHLQNQGFVNIENKMGSKELKYIENKKGNRKYTAEYSKELNGGKYYSVNFLDDNKSVIITRVSW